MDDRELEDLRQNSTLVVLRCLVGSAGKLCYHITSTILVDDEAVQ